MLTYTIYGPPRPKKNSQQIRRTAAGRPFVAPSKVFTEYERSCLAQIKTPYRPVSAAVNAKCLYYMPTAAGAQNGWTGRSPAVTVSWPMRRSGRGGTRGGSDTAGNRTPGLVVGRPRKSWAKPSNPSVVGMAGGRCGPTGSSCAPAPFPTRLTVRTGMNAKRHTKP